MAMGISLRTAIAILWCAALAVFVLPEAGSTATLTAFPEVTNRIGADNIGSPSECNVRLSGPIAAGDVNRLLDMLRALAQKDGSADFLWGYTVCLDSPGGSYSEGLELARIVIENRLPTMIEAQANCFSACALVFMAGNVDYEGKHVPKRTLNVKGNLGFQAPFVDDNFIPDGSYSPSDFSKAFEEGIQSVGRLLKLGQQYNFSLIDIDVLTDMLEKGPTNSFRIDTVVKAIRSGIDLSSADGFPFARDRAALCNVCDNKFGVFDITEPPVDCTATSFKSIRGMNWFGLYDGKGGSCVVRANKSTVQVYPNLSYDTSEVFDSEKFSGQPWYTLAPKTTIGH
jgi:hypothetical protein